MVPSDEAIDAIYAAGVDPAGWELAIRHVGSTLRAATCAFYVESHREAPTILNAGVMVGYKAADLAAYSDHFAALNPFNRADLRRDDIGVLSDTDFDVRFGRGKRFADSEYCVDWARPQSVRHVVGQRLRSSGDDVLCAAFWRPSDVGAHSPEEIAGFARLMRHINRAIDVGARLRTVEAELQATIERGGGAVFTLGRDGRVRRCNAMAEALLSSGCALVRGNGRLRASVAADQPALDRLVACVFDARLVAWAENTRLPLRRMDGGPPLVLRIASVAHRFDPFMSERAVSAIVTVEGFEASTERSAECLRRRFKLTPAQTRLALAMRSGKSLQQSAAELGIDIETARSHLKAVFARTGTHRQAELVLLLRDLDQW